MVSLSLPYHPPLRKGSEKGVIDMYTEGVLEINWYPTECGATIILEDVENIDYVETIETIKCPKVCPHGCKRKGYVEYVDGEYVVRGCQ